MKSLELGFVQKRFNVQYPITNIQMVETSLITGIGIGEVKTAMAEKLGGISHTPAHAVISERHRNLLEAARAELGQARERLADGGESAAAPAFSSEGEPEAEAPPLPLEKTLAQHQR